MAVGSTRKGVTQAKFNDDASNFVFAEIGILSGVVDRFRREKRITLQDLS